MEYIIRKKIKVDNDVPQISGTWYSVIPANPFLRWIQDNIPPFCIMYNPFSDLKEAKRCAKLKSKGKWDYIKEVSFVK